MEFIKGRMNRVKINLNKFKELYTEKKNTVFTKYLFQERKQQEKQEKEPLEDFNTVHELTKNCERIERDTYVDRCEIIKDKIITGIQSREMREKLVSQGKSLTMTKALELVNYHDVTQRYMLIDAMSNYEQRRIDLHEIEHEPCHENTDNEEYMEQINTTKNEYIDNTDTEINSLEENDNYTERIKKNIQNSRIEIHNELKNTDELIVSELNNENDHKHNIDELKDKDQHECDTDEFNKIEHEHDKLTDLYIFSIDGEQPDTVYAVLDIGSEDKIQFKIDTGAQVNVIPTVVYNKLRNPPPLSKTKQRLVSYTGQQLGVKGTASLHCSYKNERIKADFIVADGCQSQPILSLKTSLELKLIQLTLSIEQPSQPLTKERVLKEYEEVFKGFGGLEGEVSIHIKEDAIPKVHPPRRVPYAIKDKVKEELDKMVRLEVIEKVNEPTDWVNSLVVAEKPNGKLRLCLDPKDLNEAIKRPHYSTKTLEEALAEIPNAKYFSKLDAQSGYWQMKLDEKSSYLTTFNTPHGRYRFKRLPFGLVCAQDYFQMKMDQIFEGIQGVTPLVDDILIAGATRDEHDRILKQALGRAKERNLKLNPEKLTIGVQQVDYFGHLITSEGLKPDPEKVNAIRNMPEPKDKKELSTVLGMITYLSKFAPCLSEITKPMRDILKDDVEFAWDKPQKEAFEKTKQLISKTPVLTYFDPKKKLILEVDASKHGLGASIYNDGKPIAFASKALNETEQNYAQIEKELYAILFGCTRFHQYVYGRKTEVHSDHKPLESIMKKPLSSAPPRLQRMLLQLQKYDIYVKHVSGKDIPVSDALSRKHLETVDDMSKEFEASVHSVMNNLPVTDQKMKYLREQTKEDMECQQVMKYIRNGWPEKRSQCHPYAQEFWTFREELCIVEDVILKRDRIVIPKAARPKLMENLHEGHMGVEKTLQRAQTAIFWPGITNDVKVKISSCPTCIAHQPSRPKEPLQSHEVPSRPWQKLGTDMFTWNDKQFLITVDYYSRYFELDEMTSTTSNSVIKKLCHHFARHGIPETLISDNGPQYISEEFKRFSNAWDFKHVTSSPLYSQSNGLAEKTVQTAKMLLSKAKAENLNFERVLFQY